MTIQLSLLRHCINAALARYPYLYEDAVRDREKVRQHTLRQLINTFSAQRWEIEKLPALLEFLLTGVPKWTRF